MSEPLDAAVLQTCLLPVCKAAVHFLLHACTMAGTCHLVSHLPLLPCPSTMATGTC